MLHLKLLYIFVSWYLYKFRTSLLRPQTLLDHLAVAHVIEDWYCRALRWVKEEQQKEALRLQLDLLHIVGELYRRV